MPIRLCLLQAGIDIIMQQTARKLSFTTFCGSKAIPKACHRLENSFLCCSSLYNLIFFFYESISFYTYWLYVLSLICSQIFYVIILAIFHIDSPTTLHFTLFPVFSFSLFPSLCFQIFFSRYLAQTFHLLDIFLYNFLYRNNMVSFYIQNSSCLSYLPFPICESSFTSLFFL
jgi:hypothetical protein